MDWGFINIFKKADFNSLMVAVAINGWYHQESISETLVENRINYNV